MDRNLKRKMNCWEGETVGEENEQKWGLIGQRRRAEVKDIFFYSALILNTSTLFSFYFDKSKFYENFMHFFFLNLRSSVNIEIKMRIGREFSSEFIGFIDK